MKDKRQPINKKSSPLREDESSSDSDDSTDEFHKGGTHAYYKTKVGFVHIWTNL